MATAALNAERGDMSSKSGSGICFSEQYARLRPQWAAAGETALVTGEDGEAIPEQALQGIWYDQLFSDQDLRTQEGHALSVLSPGWWNHQEGPDFRGAQIYFNGKLHSGDVEVHLDPSDWKAHRHDIDSRYDEVILHVVLEDPKGVAAVTLKGRAVPTLALGSRLSADIGVLSERMLVDEHSYAVGQSPGRCAEVAAQGNPEALRNVLLLAGEWRMLNKARALRERMDEVGGDQALYEAFMYACGFGHFKHHFKAVARHLPYERARQLALQDPLLLEAAFLQIAGLLPDSLPEGTTAVPHFARLRALRRDYLSGLRSLPLTWRRVGIRPANQPERRLAGAARFLARTADTGLTQALEQIWREECAPLARRRCFEALFPGASGFWAEHCTWTGKKLRTPSMPLGAGRVRSIIGNVFVPAALATARRDRDRVKEERVYALFQHLPKEPDNHIVQVMIPRVFGTAPPKRLDFVIQQGLLQIHQDWCEANPSCHNCAMLRHLNPNASG